MRVKTLILATSAVGALALSAGVANAEPNGWYGAIDAGYHTIGTIEAVSQNVGPAPSPVFDFDVQDDWAAFARLGYRFDQNWRVELEGGYRSNDIESIVSSTAGLPTGICQVGPAAGPCGVPDGEISAATLMMNVIYDFGSEGDALRPFIGLGAGINRVNTEVLGTLGGNRTVGFGADDSSAELAAQFIGGLAFAISDRAHLDLTYRYLMSNMEFASFTSTAAANPGPFQGRYDDSHTLTLGL
ncbi:MAG: outer membrane beta-barrel protein, partial [Alphaproteobacteria bacterium]|nr:outer membrane beta-barrel protein [Alphaproteobacteria bacterium]